MCSDPYLRRGWRGGRPPLPSSSTLSTSGRARSARRQLRAPSERPADQREEEIAEGHRRRLADAELGAVDEAEESEHGARQRVDGRAMEVRVDDKATPRPKNHPGQNRAAPKKLH